MASQTANGSSCSIKQPVKGLTLTSGFQEYPKYRDQYLISPQVWLKGKQEVDNVHPYWRVHNKLYDLTPFIHKHPGGPFWIKETRGTDITESFESSHFGTAPENILNKYFIRDISTPRNSPYTFHPNGFYQTLKRKVTPIIHKVGKGPTTSMKLIQDSLALSFVISFLLAGWHSSQAWAAVSGFILGLSAIAAHNFFHQKDNWRMYLFDLMMLSSQDWRISHALSHHVFPNTIYDYEIQAFEPHLQVLPKKYKTFVDKYVNTGSLVILFLVGFFIDVTKRLILVAKKQGQLNIENIIPILQFALMIIIRGSVSVGFWLWLVVHLCANFTFMFIGLAAAHHHPEIYHEGDAVGNDKDWGLHQVSATREKGEVMSSLFLVAVTFGNHTLHHLFPTVDHSKLPHLMPSFLETCKEFGVKFELFSFKKHYIGVFKSIFNVTPNSEVNVCLKNLKKPKM